MATITNSENFIMIDGTSVAKNSLSISKTVDGVLINGVGIGKISVPLQGTTLDGVDFDTVDELHEALNAVSFRKGGGNGEGVAWSDVSWQPQPNKVAMFSEQGLLSTGTPLFPENAVPLVLLDVRLPAPPESGAYVLKSLNGVASWVEE